ncbi:MAG TPA: BTAD domain-containing putative transcriptional regulator [Candidatus Binatia bacterium]|nr:BTAD domain-containing putative transcriptional regulator [Candidatus Binatia bacterium]
MSGSERRRLGRELRSSDLVAVLDAVRVASQAQDPNSFAEAAAAGTFRLIRCDHASYNEVDLGARFWATAWPPGALRLDPSTVAEAFRRHWADSPFLNAVHPPDEPPRTWWELDPERRMRRSELWNLVYRPMGVTRQLAASLESGPARVVGLGASRASGDFSERDRAVLDIYRGQLVGQRRLLVITARLSRALPAARLTTIVIDRDGRVLSVSPDAGALTEGVLVTSDGQPRLSDAVAAWVCAHREIAVAAAGRERSQPSIPTWSPLTPGTWACLLPGPLEDLLLIRGARRAEGHGRSAPAPRLKVLGGFSAAVGADPVEMEGRPAQLVMLVAAAGGRAEVDLLVEAMWPDADPQVGRARLRTVLARVPHLAERLLVRSGESVTLAPGVELDAAAFETAARRALAARTRGEPGWTATARAALDAYTGDLLAGSCDEMWALGPRERLRRLQLGLLDALADVAAGSGDADGAVALLQRAIDVDPTDESRYQRAAELLAERGRSGAALAMLGRARSILAELRLRAPPGIAELEQRLRG